MIGADLQLQGIQQQVHLQTLQQQLQLQSLQQQMHLQSLQQQQLYMTALERVTAAQNQNPTAPPPQNIPTAYVSAVPYPPSAPFASTPPFSYPPVPPPLAPVFTPASPAPPPQQQQQQQQPVMQQQRVQAAPQQQQQQQQRQQPLQATPLLQQQQTMMQQPLQAAPLLQQQTMIQQPVIPQQQRVQAAPPPQQQQSVMQQQLVQAAPAPQQQQQQPVLQQQQPVMQQQRVQAAPPPQQQQPVLQQQQRVQAAPQQQQQQQQPLQAAPLLQQHTMMQQPVIPQQQRVQAAPTSQQQQPVMQQQQQQQTMMQQPLQAAPPQRPNATGQLNSPFRPLRPLGLSPSSTPAIEVNGGLAQHHVCAKENSKVHLIVFADGHVEVEPNATPPPETPSDPSEVSSSTEGQRPAKKDSRGPVPSMRRSTRRPCGASAAESSNAEAGVEQSVALSEEDEEDESDFGSERPSAYLRGKGARSPRVPSPPSQSRGLGRRHPGPVTRTSAEEVAAAVSSMAKDLANEFRSFCATVQEMNAAMDRVSYPTSATARPVVTPLSTFSAGFRPTFFPQYQSPEPYEMNPLTPTGRSTEPRPPPISTAAEVSKRMLRGQLPSRSYNPLGPANWQVDAAYQVELLRGKPGEGAPPPAPAPLFAERASDGGECSASPSPQRENLVTPQELGHTQMQTRPSLLFPSVMPSVLGYPMSGLFQQLQQGSSAPAAFTAVSQTPREEQEQEDRSAGGRQEIFADSDEDKEPCSKSNSFAYTAERPAQAPAPAGSSSPMNLRSSRSRHTPRRKRKHYKSAEDRRYPRQSALPIHPAPPQVRTQSVEQYVEHSDVGYATEGKPDSSGSCSCCGCQSCHAPEQAAPPAPEPVSVPLPDAGAENALALERETSQLRHELEEVTLQAQQQADAVRVLRETQHPQILRAIQQLRADLTAVARRRRDVQDARTEASAPSVPQEPQGASLGRSKEWHSRQESPLIQARLPAEMQAAEAAEPPSGDLVTAALENAISSQNMATLDSTLIQSVVKAMRNTAELDGGTTPEAFLMELTGPQEEEQEPPAEEEEEDIEEEMLVSLQRHPSCSIKRRSLGYKDSLVAAEALPEGEGGGLTPDDEQSFRPDGEGDAHGAVGGLPELTARSALLPPLPEYQLFFHQPFPLVLARPPPTAPVDKVPSPRSVSSCSCTFSSTTSSSCSSCSCSTASSSSEEDEEVEQRSDCSCLGQLEHPYTLLRLRGSATKRRPRPTATRAAEPQEEKRERKPGHKPASAHGRRKPSSSVRARHTRRASTRPSRPAALPPLLPRPSVPTAGNPYLASAEAAAFLAAPFPSVPLVVPPPAPETATNPAAVMQALLAGAPLDQFQPQQQQEGSSVPPLWCSPQAQVGLKLSSDPLTMVPTPIATPPCPGSLLLPPALPSLAPTGAVPPQSQPQPQPLLPSGGARSRTAAFQQQQLPPLSAAGPNPVICMVSPRSGDEGQTEDSGSAAGYLGIGVTVSTDGSGFEHPPVPPFWPPPPSTLYQVHYHHYFKDGRVVHTSSPPCVYASPVQQSPSSALMTFGSL